jgi:hypothetical protein
MNRLNRISQLLMIAALLLSTGLSIAQDQDRDEPVVVAVETRIYGRSSGRPREPIATPLFGSGVVSRNHVLTSALVLHPNIYDTQIRELCSAAQALGKTIEIAYTVHIPSTTTDAFKSERKTVISSVVDGGKPTPQHADAARAPTVQEFVSALHLVRSRGRKADDITGSVTLERGTRVTVLAAEIRGYDVETVRSEAIVREHTHDGFIISMPPRVSLRNVLGGVVLNARRAAAGVVIAPINGAFLLVAPISSYMSALSTPIVAPVLTLSELSLLLMEGTSGDRVFAAEHLAAIPEPRALEALVRGLDDSDPYVVSSCAYGSVSVSRHLEMPQTDMLVASLIQALKKWTAENYHTHLDGKAASAVEDALRKLTGMDFGRNAEAWDEWRRVR